MWCCQCPSYLSLRWQLCPPKPVSFYLHRILNLKDLHLITIGLLDSKCLHFFSQHQMKQHNLYLVSAKSQPVKGLSFTLLERQVNLPQVCIHMYILTEGYKTPGSEKKTIRYSRNAARAALPIGSHTSVSTWWCDEGEMLFVPALRLYYRRGIPKLGDSKWSCWDTFSFPLSGWKNRCL